MALIKPTKKKRNQEERKLQVACVQWFRYQYPKFVRLLVGSLNGVELVGTERERAIMGKRMKDEGLVPGASDLFLLIPRGELHGLAIEMKTPTGIQSDNQIEFEKDVIEQGYGYVMPRTIEAFMSAIKAYLERGEY